MLSERVKEDKREYVDKATKKIILSKSKGVCCHCGETLTLKSMTVDHAIPLSKGGKSDISNYVALCKSCNKTKSNLVLDLKGYYKYLPDIFLNPLSDRLEKYIEEVEWVGMRNFFPYDEYQISVEVDGVEITNLWGKEIEASFNKSLKFNFRKMKKSQLQVLLNYYRKRSESLNLKYKEQTTLNYLENLFRRGTIYALMSDSGYIHATVEVKAIHLNMREYSTKLLNVNVTTLGCYEVNEINAVALSKIVNDILKYTLETLDLKFIGVAVSADRGDSVANITKSLVIEQKYNGDYDYLWKTKEHIKIEESEMNKRVFPEYYSPCVEYYINGRGGNRVVSLFTCTSSGYDLKKYDIIFSEEYNNLMDKVFPIKLSYDRVERKFDIGILPKILVLKQLSKYDRFSYLKLTLLVEGCGLSVDLETLEKEGYLLVQGKDAYITDIGRSYLENNLDYFPEWISSMNSILID